MPGPICLLARPKEEENPNLVVRCTRLWEEAISPKVLLQPQLHIAQKGHKEVVIALVVYLLYAAERIGQQIGHNGSRSSSSSLPTMRRSEQW